MSVSKVQVPKMVRLAEAESLPSPFSAEHWYVPEYSVIAFVMIRVPLLSI